MKILDTKKKADCEILCQLFHRASCPQEIADSANKIVQEVKKDGNKAVLAQIKKFDGVTLTAETLCVSKDEFELAKKQVSKEMKQAIDLALEHITVFAKETLPKSWSEVVRPGVTLGEQYHPMSRVACYVPGGTAPLVSSAIHTIGIAKAANVEQIIGVTPPRKDGTINPATLYAMKRAGADVVYKIGGATAIAAMAYGTETIQPVEKIVGPGNAYVAAAKKIVYGQVAIDMVAGPSEVMVIADEFSNPAWIAADLLSQAEHGSGLEQAVLVTDSEVRLKEIKEEIEKQSKSLTRQGPLSKVIENGMYLVLCKNLDEACEIASNYAPEHLELQIRTPRAYCRKIKAAGAIFMGGNTPEPVGDFTAGPSHVLPTGGTAKFFHGLTSSDFLRRSSLLQYSNAALCKDAVALALFAAAEGLDAHGRSAAIRTENNLK